MKKGKQIFFIMIFSISLFCACGGGGGGGGTADEGTPDDTIDVSAERARTEDILYAAFAGSANDGVTFPLYEIMVNGFITMGWNLVDDIKYTIYDEISDDEGNIDFTKLIGTHTYNITNSAYKASLTLTVPFDISLPIKFEGTLTVDFNNTGYSAGLCTFSGTKSGDELSIIFNGYIDEDFYFRTLDITAFNQLQLLYNGKTAIYNNWNIPMNIFYGSEDPYAGKEDPITKKTVSKTKSTNLSFLSGSMENETKDFTLGGSFTLDEGTYTFNSGFKYIQSLDSTENLLVTSANGKIKVPGMDSAATIKSSFSTSDPEGKKTIASAADSFLWESGQMTITSSSGSIIAAFDDGTVNFSGGDLGSWSLAGWQLLLDPLK